MIEIILLTSLFSFGLYVTTHHPYLLYPVRYFIGIILLDGKEDFEMDSAGQVTEVWYEFRQKWKGYIWKPLLGCLPCMASFWGLVTYLLFSDISLLSVVQVPFVIVCASGVNYMLNRHILKYFV